MPGRHREGYDVVLTDHVFDKVRSIDMTLAEFEVLLDEGEVIDEEGVKERSSSWSGRGHSTSSLSWMTSARRSVS